MLDWAACSWSLSSSNKSRPGWFVIWCNFQFSLFALILRTFRNFAPLLKKLSSTKSWISVGPILCPSLFQDMRWKFLALSDLLVAYRPWFWTWFSANWHWWLRSFVFFSAEFQWASCQLHMPLNLPRLCLIKSNTFWKSMKQLIMCLPFRFAFPAICLMIRICCTVLLSLLIPACSSDKCISICAFNLSNNTIFSTLHGLGEQLFCNCCIETGLLSSVMWRWPIFSIPLVCSLSISVTFSPPTWIISPVMPSIPGLLCFFSLFTVVSISLYKIWCSSSLLGGGMISNHSIAFCYHQFTNATLCVQAAAVFCPSFFDFFFAM